VSDYQESDLKQWLAKQAITEVLHLYCRSMDRNDAELGKRVWHPGGTADYPPYFKGTGADFVDMSCAFHAANLIAHQHQVTNTVIMVHGDTANAETYVFCVQRSRKDGQLQDLTIHGRYLDDFAYRNGRWAIDARTYVEDFCDTRIVTDASSVSRSRRTPEDPSYVTLKGL
jgi:hypothetical protein